MSGIGGGTSAFESLLKLVGDPAAHQARLDELKNAEQAANDAQHNLAAAKDELATAAAAHAAQASELSDREREFEATKRAVLEQSAGLDARQADLRAREAAADALEKDLNAKVAAHEQASTAKTAELTYREDAVARREQAAGAREVEIAALQKEWQEKLPIMRAIVIK